MKRIVFTAVLLVLLCAAHKGFAQTVNSQVGGVVQDASKALIPGVTITLTNTATSVTNSQLTNESGAYSFPVVPPGTYSMTAALTGFNTSVVKELAVGTSTQVRWNFTMEIGASSSKVEVSVSALQLLTESSASIGDVLSPERVVSLPMVKQNVLDLVRITPGFRQGLAGDANTTFAGLPIGTVNTVRDGLTVTDTRSNSVLSSTANINPDLVGEIRIILAPVDAEQGRGNGQILIQTRSGTNRFSGSAVLNARPSAFNANLWGNNRNIDPATGLWKPTPLDWRNTFEGTVSYGGPIVKNKTFFFALYDQNYSNTRTLQSNNVLTDTARQGIFRYFTGWNNGNALTPIPSFPASATTGTYPVVDYAGNPVAPAFNPNGTPYTGGLRCYSVFGNVKADGSAFTAADCPGGTAIIGAAWDPLRPGMDSTGYIQKILAAMPHANFFSPGGTTVDGLNLAQNQFVRTRGGTTGGASGTSPELVNRKQLNVKIDENFNAQHRLSVGWTYQADNSADNVANWPNGFNGDSRRRPQVVTVNFTSTLTPRLINEARFGTTLGSSSTNVPWESPDTQTRDGASAFLLQGGTNATTGGVYPIAFTPGAGNFAFGNNVINAATGNGGFTISGDDSPLYSFADSLGWTVGQHAFRMGAELRLTRSNGYSGANFPTASGGAGGQNSPLGSTIAALPGQLQGNQTNAASMLYFLNGSVNSATMNYWIDSPQDVTNGTWEDYVTSQRRYRKQIANEAAFFWKDDWKLNKRLTVNLGIRFEYFGQPYLDGGYTTSVVGQADGLFGAGRTTASPFDTWMHPGNLFLTGYGPNATTTPTLTCANGVVQSAQLPTSTCDPDKMTTIQFVGPGSDHPDQSATPNDLNNFGPAIGFSWQLPWFGEGKTSVRGGFQLTYGGAGRNANNAENLIGNVPGNISVATLQTSNYPQLVNSGRALTLVDLPLVVPVIPSSPAVPGGQIPIYNGTTALSAVDPAYRTPYTENFTFSVTRSLGRNMTLDLNYVGVIGKKLPGTMNINTTDVYYNKELLDALTITRAGGDAPLFDQMFAGLDIHGTGTAATTGVNYGPVGTFVTQPVGNALTPPGLAGTSVLQSGSAQLRRNATFTNNLALGNFDAVAAAIQSLNTVQSGLLAQPAGVAGRVLRNGCDRLATGQTTIGAGNSNALRCFPENYIVANPQIGTATYTGNISGTNYQSLTVQYTLRPVQGINFQTTYAFAKTMGLPTSGYTDPLDRNADYAPAYLSVKHDFHTNGTFELPFGPNKLLFGNATGWIARVMERWQTSVIYNAFSGNPRTVIGGRMLYAGGLQTLNMGQSRMSVASEEFDLETKGHAQWDGPNNATGTYYGKQFILTPDPQCAVTNATDTMGFNLFTNGSCTLNALAKQNPDGSAGALMLVNPSPGQRGTMPLSLSSIGKWRLDANIGKTFRISESKSLQIRFDASNILNHPDLSDPQPQTGQSVNTPGIVFGRIPDKGGSLTGTTPRTFQGQLRFNF